MLLDKTLVADISPVATQENVIIGKNWRITVLTDRLLRVEISKTNDFCDEATQTVFFRNTPPVKYSVEQKNGRVLISTDRCEFLFSERKKRIMSVKIDGKYASLSDKNNLKGTCRTLDGRMGRVKLSNGVISKGGVAILPDNGLAVRADGTVGPRQNPVDDKYIFAYGHDYRQALKDFYLICGKVPMLPRYVLGNWWSRYRAYTQDEYLSLMDRFIEENLPFTVATVDMDWHWVDVNSRFNASFPARNIANGPGWTGYSWNTELFPDYKDFLKKLHEKNLHVTLNLHPADGIRFFEDMYEELARSQNIDPTTKETVKFDLSNNGFINNYFKIVHHPYEEDGVNFWWIDWQQGKKSTVPGLDPLWALNHYHFLDNSRENRRGLILSRFAGAGSHRYPLGFSGDSITYWRTLKFQPYMTAVASNVGYSWWSHDIGGHQLGVYNDEMYLRWCQYGVFSPINRLHSTSHDLQGKEPWKHSETTRRIVGDFLRLRHRLLPYIYTAMRRTYVEGKALCEPMFYEYPEEEDAYRVENEYFFGSELIVCPVVSPLRKNLNMAKTEIWVPEGRFTDVFTGKIYEGKRAINVFRDLENMPVMAKSGAIIPLSDDSGNDCKNPEKMEVWVYRGNGSYSLYEDDGETLDCEKGEYAETLFTVAEENGAITFTVSAPSYGGEKFRLPENRAYRVVFRDVVSANATVNGARVDFDGSVTVKSGDAIVLTDIKVLTNGDPLENAKVVLSRYQAGTISKILRYFGMKKIKDLDVFLKKVKRRFPKDVYLAVLEAVL